MTARRTRRPRPPRHTGGAYLDATHRPLHALLLIAPLLAFYHIAAAVGDRQLALAARWDLLRALGWFGISGAFLAPAMIVVVLLAQHVARRDPWRPQGRTLALMVGEALLWTLPIIVLGLLRGQLRMASGSAGGADAFGLLVAGVGAGIYEEFLFRLVLISLALLIFVDILSLPEPWVVFAAVVVSAALFGLYHPVTTPNGIDWTLLLVQSTKGVLWGVLYVYRGFGVCVLSHVSWNVFVRTYAALA